MRCLFALWCFLCTVLVLERLVLLLVNGCIYGDGSVLRLLSLHSVFFLLPCLVSNQVGSRFLVSVQIRFAWFALQYIWFSCLFVWGCACQWFCASFGDMWFCHCDCDVIPLAFVRSLGFSSSCVRRRPCHVKRVCFCCSGSCFAHVVVAFLAANLWPRGLAFGVCD